jgi:Ca2+-transporting ATPase
MESTHQKWHALETDEVIQQMNSSVEGLAGAEAKKRLSAYGENRINKKNRESLAVLLWRQVNNPLIWVLIGSTILAMLVGKVSDGLIVLLVVVINTMIGFIQELKAGKAIEALGEMIPENATVLRDGKKSLISVAHLVPGDIVHLAAGDRVPADMRIVLQKNLLVEEAALTGESFPVQKSLDPVAKEAVLGDRTCMVYGGTLVTAGTAMAVVTATGMNTELGKISDMLSSATETITPLTKKLAVIGKYLTIGIVSLTLVMMIVGTIRATSQGILLAEALTDSLMFAIALAVGAIPEGLPAVVTIALAIGVQRMARRNAIIRKLPAVETLGSTTVICTDKTGTLTRNEMAVTEVWTEDAELQISGAGYIPEGSFYLKGVIVNDIPEAVRVLLKNSILCSDASIRVDTELVTHEGDPTEVALVVAAAKAAIDVDGIRKTEPRLDVVPFDSDLQYMAVLVNQSGARVLIIKGAPEVIMKKCEMYENGKPLVPVQVHERIELMGSRGMRVLAVASKVLDKTDFTTIDPADLIDGFRFSGLTGMIDPPRPEVIEAIRQCHNAGIVVKMITGDHQATARAIGMELGLSSNGKVITGADLSVMDDPAFRETVNTTNIFARVAPEHKLKLVKALQENHQIVAMTGDGVNDAPSLKQSNIGIAMGITGTSVSKESADIVLTDDNFSSISAAVEEGRRVYDNLVKSLAFLLPTNIGLAFILMYGILFFPFNPITNILMLPILPAQLLWINLVAGIALALPIAFEVPEPNVMNRPPRNPDEPLFNRFVAFRVVFVSLLMTTAAILLFNFEYSAAISENQIPAEALKKAQSMVVTFIIMFQVFYMLNCRSLKDSLLKIGFFSNRVVFAGIGVIISLQLLLIYTPFMQSIFGTTALDFRDILMATLTGFLILPVIWIEKQIITLKSNAKAK